MKKVRFSISNLLTNKITRMNEKLCYQIQTRKRKRKKQNHEETLFISFLFRAQLEGREGQARKRMHRDNSSTHLFSADKEGERANKTVRSTTKALVSINYLFSALTRTRSRGDCAYQRRAAGLFMPPTCSTK